MSSARDRFPQNCCEHSDEQNSTGDILNEVPMSPSESLLTEPLSVPPACCLHHCSLQPRGPARLIKEGHLRSDHAWN